MKYLNEKRNRFNLVKLYDVAISKYPPDNTKIILDWPLLFFNQNKEQLSFYLVKYFAISSKN